MQSRILAFVLLIAYSFSVVRPLFPVVDYVLHKEQIASTLCENRDKPMMNCHGKCHLQKQLVKAEKSNLPSKQEQKEKFEDSIVYEKEFNSISSNEKISSAAFYHGNLLIGNLTTAEHPPCA